MKKILYVFLGMVLFLGVIIAYNNVFYFFNVKVDESGLCYDAKEDVPRYQILIKKAGQEADAELMEQGYKRVMGYCYAYWRLKKKILKEKYNINWRTPAELNPDVIFD